MINSVRFKNFKCHRDAKFEFTEGVNVIVGGNDKGKTTLQKGTRHIALGDIRGDSYISHGEKQCEMTLVANGHTVTRRKGTKKHCTIDGEDFPNPNEMDDKIKALLGLDEINFQSQEEPPFLLSLTPGQVARTFNTYADLDALDKLSTNLAGRRRDSATLLNSSKDDLRETSLRLDDFNGLGDIQIEKIKLLKETYDKGVGDYETLFDFYESVTASRDSLKAYDGLNNAVEGHGGLLALNAELDTLSEQKRLYGGLLERLRVFGNDKALKIPALARLEKRFGEKHAASVQVENLGKLKFSIVNAKNNLEASRIELDALKKELVEKIGDVCPLCGQNIEKDCWRG